MSQSYGRTYPIKGDASLYRKIVQHKPIDDTERSKLAKVKFQFEAVFNRFGPNVTAACPCAYTHEFFDYIDADGKVDQSMLEQLCEAIDNGQCEHVKSAKPTDVIGTAVTVLHVAIAAKNEALYLGEPEGNRIGFFQLYDYHIALLKVTSTYFQDEFSGEIDLDELDADLCDFYYLDLPTYVETTEGFHSQEPALRLNFCMTAVGICIEKDDINLLQLLLQHGKWKTYEWDQVYCSDILNVIQSTSLQSRDVWLALLLDMADQLDYKHDIRKYINAAIALENIDALRIIFQRALKYKNAAEIVTECLHFATALDCRRSQDFLKEQKLFNAFPTEISSFAAYKTLIRLTLAQMRSTGATPVNLDLFSERLHTLKRGGFDINAMGMHCANHSLNNVAMSPLIYIYTPDPSIILIYPEIVEILLDAGSDINVKDSSGQSALQHVLKTRVRYADKNGTLYRHMQLRRILKAMLYQNPVRVSGCIRDAYIKTQEQHSLVKRVWKYDPLPEFAVATEGTDYVLPLLLESGATTEHTCTYNLSTKDFPRQVIEYVESCAAHPRTLQHQCRVKLRSTFPGKQVHRYLDKCSCPNSIKRYILMSDLLGK